MKTIIGVVGEAGSGKSQVADTLESLGCPRLSLSDVLREIAGKVGLSHSRENLINLGNALREQFGPDILARGIESRLMQIDSELVVVESIRNPEELRFIRTNHQSVMIGVTMDSVRKFELMQKRNREGDPKSLEEYLVFRRKELGEGVGSSGIKIQECLDMCDITIQNDGTLEELVEIVSEVKNEITRRGKEY